MSGSAKLNVLISLQDRISGAYNKIYNKLEGLNKPVAKFKKSNLAAFSAIQDHVPGIGGMLGTLSNPYTIAAAGAVALGAATVKAVQSANSFETGMQKINTTAQLSQTELEGLRNELMDIGRNSGGNFNKIPESFEKIISQVGDTETSLSILRASTQGAKAGFTDLDIVSGALGQSLSTIGKENANAQDVLDTFFAAKRVGAGEFSDFANYLPTLIAAGKNLGIQYKDVAGIFAYMTAKGQDASSATMLMENAFTALSKSEITKGLAKNGVQVFDKKGTMRDMGAIMADLKTKLDSFGKNDKAKSNFLESIGLKDAQAKNAFSILTSDAKLLQTTMGQVRDSAGETKKALENSSNPARTWGDIMDKVSFITTKIGYMLLPYVGQALDKINIALDWVTSHWDAISSSVGFIGKLLMLPQKLIWGMVDGVAQIFGGWTAIGGAIVGVIAIAKTLFSVLEGAGKVFIGLRTRNMEMVDSGRKLASAAVDEISKKGLGGIYSEARDKFTKASEIKAPEVEKSFEWKGADANGGGDTSANAAGPGANMLNDVVSGGTQNKTFNVNIRALNEGGITIKSTTLTEGANEVEKKVIEMFLRAVRNVETAF